MKAALLTQHLTYLAHHARIVYWQFEKKHDPDLLHDFRTTMRKLRSLTKFFADENLQFPNTLKAYIRQTNEIRELDVFIETLEKYPKIRSELMILRSKKIAEIFTSDFTEKLTSELVSYSQLLYRKNPAFSSESTIDKVLNHFKECQSKFMALDQNEKSKTLHKLRIRFKDARYIFEFLDQMGLLQSSVYIETCKQTQNNLGVIQDTKNQIQWLKHLASENPTLHLEKIIAARKRKLKKLKGTIQSN